MSENHLSKPNGEERRRRLAKSVLLLKQYFEKWRRVYPSHEVGKELLAIYLEALQNMRPDELEMGCRKVIETAVTFPKPAEIIRAARTFCDVQLLGPRLEQYEPVSEEERAEGLKYSEDLRKKLLAIPEPFRNVDGTHTERCLCRRCRARRNSA